MRNPITWRNVRGSDDTGHTAASLILGRAQESFNSGLQNLRSALGDAQQVRADNRQNTIDNNTAAYLDQLAQINSVDGLDSSRAALQAQLNGYGAMIDRDQVRGALDNRLTELRTAENAQREFERGRLMEEVNPALDNIRNMILNGAKTEEVDAAIAPLQAQFAKAGVLDELTEFRQTTNKRLLEEKRAEDAYQQNENFETNLRGYIAEQNQLWDDMLTANNGQVDDLTQQYRFMRNGLTNLAKEGDWSAEQEAAAIARLDQEWALRTNVAPEDMQAIDTERSRIETAYRDNIFVNYANKTPQEALQDVNNLLKTYESNEDNWTPDADDRLALQRLVTDGVDIDGSGNLIRVPPEIAVAAVMDYKGRDYVGIEEAVRNQMSSDSMAQAYNDYVNGYQPAISQLNQYANNLGGVGRLRSMIPPPQVPVTRQAPQAEAPVNRPLAESPNNALFNPQPQPQQPASTPSPAQQILQPNNRISAARTEQINRIAANNAAYRQERAAQQARNEQRATEIFNRIMEQGGLNTASSNDLNELFELYQFISDPGDTTQYDIRSARYNARQRERRNN